MMPKTLLLFLCSLPVLLNAAEVHDHGGQTGAQLLPQVKQQELHHAQDAPVMVHAGTEDLIASLNFDRLEWQKNPEGETQLVWDFSAYVGNDHSRWWLKSEGAAVDESTEDASVQLLYSQPVSPFWDLQFGLYSQIEPWQENYLQIGLFGLAPYFVNIDSYVLLNTNGDVAWRMDADYDIKLSTNWLLLLDGKVIVQGQNKPESGIGSGLSEGEFGVRVAYQKQRKLVPYMGIEWDRSFGNSADAKAQLQESASEWRGVVGVNIWY